MRIERTPFDEAMYTLYYKIIEETGYRACLLLDMLNRKRGIQTACLLFNAPQESEIYMTLLQRGRLDLSVEALVIESLEWRNLFTREEIAKAERRLVASQYIPKEPA